MERRVAWLNRQIQELELENVDVVRARAEEAGLNGRLDQVTARAVSALRTLIPITAPLLKPGGELLLMKGAGVTGEIDAAEKAIRKFRLEDVEVVVVGEGVVDDVTRVFRARVPRA
jgi:16S rRNA (guanine527-N7)-methyltransferase